MASKKADSRIESWTTLRFVFIIGVVLYHTNSYFEHSGGAYFYFVYRWGGAFCNYFFFLLSGILAAKTYRDLLMTSSDITIGQFIVRKISKIYPLYLLCDVVMIIYQISVNGWGILKVKRIVMDLLLISNGWVMIDEGVRGPYDGPGWFLSVLILCEIVYFSVCKLTAKSKDAYKILIGIIIFIGLYLEHNEVMLPFLYRTTGEGYMNFFLGAMLYEIYENILKNKRKVADGVILCIFSFTVIGTILLGADLLWGDSLVVVSMISALVIYIAYSISWVKKFLELKPFVLLGNISMEIFLAHMPWLNIYQTYISEKILSNMSNNIQYFIYFVTLLLICMVLHCIMQMVKKQGRTVYARET